MQCKPDCSDFLSLSGEDNKTLFYNDVNFKFYITVIEKLLPVSAGSKGTRFNKGIEFWR